MNKRNILILIIILASTALNARSYTTIKGTIEGANGYSIRLLTWSDQITYIEKKLASAVIDEKGNFNLIAEIKETTYAFFAIGNIKADIILKPGRAYEIKFDKYPALSYLETRNLLLQGERINYEILNEAEDDINRLVKEATITYNRYIAENYMDIYLQRHENINTFIDTFFLRFGEFNDPWFMMMVDYKIAMLKLAGMKIPMELAHKLWFKDRDFEYSHPDFMDLFNDLFGNYLTTRLKNYTYYELRDVINNKGSFFRLSELIGRDTVLRNEVLREMVILKGLSELYHDRNFNKENVLKILRYISSSSKFKAHRSIASNIIFTKTRYNRGIMAPDFSLPDSSGISHSISDYRGKYLYLIYFMSNCIPCLAEFKYLETLYDDLSPNLDVLAIGMDPDPDKLWNVIDQQKYPWTTVHFNNDFEMLDRFSIKNFPFFILIDPDGAFQVYSARKPSAHFHPWFKEAILNKR